MTGAITRKRMETHEPNEPYSSRIEGTSGKRPPGVVVGKIQLGRGSLVKVMMRDLEEEGEGWEVEEEEEEGEVGVQEGLIGQSELCFSGGGCYLGI